MLPRRYVIAYLSEMHQFFGIYTRLACTLLILGGIVLFQFPERESFHERPAFSNWVIQHLAQADSETKQAPRQASKAEYLSFLQDLITPRDDESGDNAPVGNGGTHIIIPSLYLALEQHHDATDMAGTFSGDRIHLQSLLKFFGSAFSPDAYLASAYPALKFNNKARALYTGDGFIPFSRLPLSGGISINAP